MPPAYVKPERIPLYKHPEYTEKWVQELIAQDPSIIGLGDLDLLAQERIQPRAGRLDLEARDEVDAAEAALQTVEESVGGEERETVEARRRVDAYVNGVLLANVATLVEEAKAVEDDLIRRRAVLLHLLSLTGEEYRREPTSEVAITIRRFLYNVPQMPGSGMVVYPGWDVHPALDSWKQAREALVTDAEAPLPER